MNAVNLSSNILITYPKFNQFYKYHSLNILYTKKEIIKMAFNRLKTTVLLSALCGLFIGIGYLIGNKTGMIIGFSIAMIINFSMYWFSDKIVLKMYDAKVVSKDHKLYKIVEELAHSAKIPMPKVYTITASSPNAFATGRNYTHSAVAATESLLEVLTHEEVKAVMAHEISHIKHRDTLIQTIAVGIACAIAMVAEIMQWALIFGMGGDDENGGSIIGLILLIILVPIIATLIQLAISRQREYLADAGACNIMKTHQPLINALQKLENAGKNVDPDNHPSHAPAQSLFIINSLNGSSVWKLFSTHPATEDRVKAMRELKLQR